MARKPSARSVRKVGAVTTDWSQSVADERGYPAMGGAGWARIGQVAKRSQHHWVVGRALEINKSLAVATWDDQSHTDCAIIVVQRYMQAPFVSLCRKAVGSGQILVNDVDDWFWGLHPENAAFKATNPATNKYANTNYYKEIILLCGAVVVSTTFLAEQLRSWNDNLRVEVIPNGVDIRLFPKHRHRRSDPVIGWAGSTAHRSGDLAILRKPFAALDDHKFHHTGHNPGSPSFAEQTGIHKRNLSVTHMLAPHEYPYGLNFDIGVIPLVDIPFNHAKSNIKGLEFAAAGIPFVASPLPEYVRLAEEYGIGRLAKTDRDWIRHLKALHDVELRIAEGSAMRDAISTNRLDARQQARQWDELVWSV